jgi:hypothetical protein
VAGSQVGDRAGVKRWAWSVLIALDQLGNALAGGNPDETISSRLGKLQLRHYDGTIPRSAWLGLARPLNAVLDWLDPGHSIGAIEWDEARIRAAGVQALLAQGVIVPAETGPSDTMLA